MTLCTHVYIHEEIEPMLVFAKCRDLLGCDKTHTAKFDFRFGEGEEWTVLNEAGQGLPALLYLEFCPGQALRTPSESRAHGKYCEDGCDGSSHDPPCWIDVSFDTAYGYVDENGEGCGHLHVRLLAELGAWIERAPSGGRRSGTPSGARWSWRNEFTGEVHEGPDRLYELVDSGEKAHDWFTNVVRPAIEADIVGSGSVSDRLPSP